MTGPATRAVLAGVLVHEALRDRDATLHARWHRALDDLAVEAPGPIRDHIEQHDVRVRDDAVARVLALCQEWDRLSKGETPTTARIRAAIEGSSQA